jgi:tRNA(Ile)-lysidine synthase
MIDRPDWTIFHARLHRTLRQRQLLAKHQRILVAVSGGQDSLCLTRLLLDLQPKWKWQLAIAHCDHRWQADLGNAEFVSKIAQVWQLPCYVETAAQIDTSEGAARQWRYQALNKIAQQHGYSTVVTGHTGSDRAETLLYNLIRGTGADGLQALTWQRDLAPGLRLVRPLLDFTRAETAQFCQAAQITFWSDRTNDDWHYARNRIRQELLPYLQTHFNPQVEQALTQTAELLRADVEYLEDTAIQLWQQAIAPDSHQKINRRLLQTIPLALQRRVMRHWLLEILPISPDFDQIEKLTCLIDAPNRSQTDPFSGGAIAQVRDDWISIVSLSTNQETGTTIPDLK